VLPKLCRKNWLFQIVADVGFEHITDGIVEIVVTQVKTRNIKCILCQLPHHKTYSDERDLA
jgi:hypothetical protein